ncbi:MAG: FHA domain-containing protein, partial [Bdellovibrionota bacterium]
MYKLVIVDGPNRGNSFVIRDGENFIGRQAGNAVVLASSKVSKQHCVLVVNNNEITLKDEGSSNGTFVNGVLTRLKKLGPGDRIGVGDYILEISNPAHASKRAPAAAGGGMGNVVRLPVPMRAQLPPAGMSPGGYGTRLGLGALGTGSAAIDPTPKDFKSRMIYLFEKKVMPTFYGMGQKTEIRAVALGLIGVLVLGSLVIVIPPLLESADNSIVRESAKRANFMAKEIVDRNTAAIASRMETKTEIGDAEYADGVRVAVITDLEGRIIAPAAKMNSHLSGGPEGSFAIKARDRFRNGLETGLIKIIGTSLVIAVEPFKVLNPNEGKNVPVAMAIVSIDTSISTLSLGEIGVIYSQAFIYLSILALLVVFILYRLILRPFQVLNEDMDKVLKGDLAQVTHEFKIEELDSLWEIINAALQRIPKSGASILMGGDTTPVVDEFLAPLKMFDSGHGIAVFDSNKKFVYANSLFEEITGIRADGAMG